MVKRFSHLVILIFLFNSTFASEINAAEAPSTAPQPPPTTSASALPTSPSTPPPTTSPTTLAPENPLSPPTGPTIPQLPTAGRTTTEDLIDANGHPYTLVIGYVSPDVTDMRKLYETFQQNYNLPPSIGAVVYGGMVLVGSITYQNVTEKTNFYTYKVTFFNVDTQRISSIKGVDISGSQESNADGTYKRTSEFVSEIFSVDGIQDSNQISDKEVLDATKTLSDGSKFEVHKDLTHFIKDKKRSGTHTETLTKEVTNQFIKTNYTTRYNEIYSGQSEHVTKSELIKNEVDTILSRPPITIRTQSVIHSEQFDIIGQTAEGAPTFRKTETDVTDLLKYSGGTGKVILDYWKFDRTIDGKFDQSFQRETKYNAAGSPVSFYAIIQNSQTIPTSYEAKGPLTFQKQRELLFYYPSFQAKETELFKLLGVGEIRTSAYPNPFVPPWVSPS